MLEIISLDQHVGSRPRVIQPMRQHLHSSILSRHSDQSYVSCQDIFSLHLIKIVTVLAWVITFHIFIVRPIHVAIIIIVTTVIEATALFLEFNLVVRQDLRLG